LEDFELVKALWLIEVHVSYGAVRSGVTQEKDNGTEEMALFLQFEKLQ
jgi:hypothetical protein